MAKMSIHIPDEILAKLQPHKDRMNISRVCSAALLKEVEVLENIPPLVDETRKMIDRLRGEVHKNNVDSFNLGVKLARAFMSRVTFEQLRFWGSFVFSERKNIVLPEEVEDYIERCMLEHKFRNFHKPSFSRGWLSVMKGAWESAKDRI